MGKQSGIEEVYPLGREGSITPVQIELGTKVEADQVFTKIDAGIELVCGVYIPVYLGVSVVEIVVWKIFKDLLYQLQIGTAEGGHI